MQHAYQCVTVINAATNGSTEIVELSAASAPGDDSNADDNIDRRAALNGTMGADGTRER